MQHLIGLMKMKDLGTVLILIVRQNLQRVTRKINKVATVNLTDHT